MISSPYCQLGGVHPLHSHSFKDFNVGLSQLIHVTFVSLRRDMRLNTVVSILYVHVLDFVYRF